MGVLNPAQNIKLCIARQIEPLDLRSLEHMGVIHKVGDIYQFTPSGDGVPRVRVPPSAPNQVGPSSSHTPSALDDWLHRLEDSVLGLSDWVDILNQRFANMHVLSSLQSQNLDAFFAHIGFQPPHPPHP